MISSEDFNRHSEIVTDFSRMFYEDYENTWETTTYRGVKVLKNPCDLWQYQELIWEVQPRLIIETGTAHGGSALYLADLAQHTSGEVITIDIHGTELYPSRPTHTRLSYIQADSADPHTRERINMSIIQGPKMVILDSDHRKDHVLKELDLWADIVTVGSYLIVEDTNINGHPVVPEHGPGPWEALEEWLPDHPEFVSDISAEKYKLTFNPGGYLKRLE